MVMMNVTVVMPREVVWDEHFDAAGFVRDETAYQLAKRGYRADGVAYVKAVPMLDQFVYTTSVPTAVDWHADA